MLRVHNDRTHQVEEFAPQTPPRVAMYTCGPTVYNLSHLGHAKCYVSWDVVHRYLEYRGFDVTMAVNFTDVDDKIIHRAQEEGEDWRSLAERYTREYLADMDALNIRRADLYPKATEHIPEMIAHIEGLIANGHAYPSGGDVYYAVESFPHYGELSGRTLEQMQAGARVEVDEKKRHPMDFALWKGAKPGEPYWDSPWGPGRPGWHIECSAMARKHLGDTLDIHTGGLDLTFPHHENEIAQSEGLTDHTFARYWFHNGFVTVNAEKMSKSLGNFETLRDLFKTYDPQTVRYFLLLGHYRQEVDFSDEGLVAARTGLSRLRKSLARFKDALAPETPGVAELERSIEASFVAAMDDDFNTPKGIASLFEAAKAIADLPPADAPAAGHAVAQVYALGEVLGLDLATLPPENRDLADVAEGLSRLADTHGVPGAQAEEWLTGLISARTQAKANKQWAAADGIRDGLKALGIALMDRPGGETAWERVEPVAAGR
jgi:cysteinyl-tRNA synthetase